MKKSLLIIAAVALFAACSENDTVKDIDTQEVAIGFDGKYVNKVTRAEITESWFANADENHFGVYGYKDNFQLFNNEDVQWDNTNHDWVHSTVRFWDKSVNTYNFYAHAPYAAAHTFTDKKYTFTGIPVIKDITQDNADIAIATPITGMGYGNCTQTNDTDHGHGEGHVEFDFNHILSKLAFRVKTSVNPNYAEIKVTAVELDFPQGTASWTQTSATDIPGTTSYSTYTAKDAVSGNVTDMTKFETSVFSGTTAALNSNAAELVDVTTQNKGKVFIVAPVTGSASGDGSEHVFGVKVTYNIQYKKESATPGTYENDGNPEVGCIATGVIGGHATDQTKQYKPTQNSSYIVTIDVNPAQIEFCVDDVISWASDTPRDVEVK